MCLLLNENFFALNIPCYRCFQFSTVEDIVAALQAETIAGGWARDSLKQLAEMSPTSLKISLQLFQLSASLSFTECMKLEYQLASKVLVKVLQLAKIACVSN